MHVIHARNVNDAYHKGLGLLMDIGVRQPSRNGDVIRAMSPVTTVYGRPWERVLFDAQRNANPFFHLFESLWMLDGRDDVYTMDQFLRSFAQFSDDGEHFHGAYGRRWRHHFSRRKLYIDGGPPLDQLDSVIKILEHDHNDRRAMIQIWDPVVDLGIASKDIPCNQSVNVQVVGGKLDIQVFCRSNDIVLGCYGANAVHFSFLQEYLAAMIGVEIGRYYQISSNYHAYTDSPYNLATYWPIAHYNLAEPGASNPYDEAARGTIESHMLVMHPPSFDEELKVMMHSIENRAFHEMDTAAFQNSFFPYVAQPMYIAYSHYREGDIPAALRVLETARVLNKRDVDWLVAATQWLERIQAKRWTPVLDGHRVSHR